MKPEIVIGVDLSLTGLALVRVPTSWNLDWSKIHSRTLTTPKELGMTARRALLAESVAQWIEWATNGRKLRTAAWFEGYPIGGRVFNLDKLCELGGVVKHELWRQLRIEVGTAPQSSARKLILGKLPRKGAKLAVMESVKAMTNVFDTDDERDAFVAANYGLAQCDAPFVTLAEAA